MADEASKEGFSLSKAFKTVAKVALWTAATFVAGGLIDLALFHYSPGGVALFELVKPKLLYAFNALGIDQGLNAIATVFGGGTQVIAQGLGGIQAANGAFIPGY